MQNTDNSPNAAAKTLKSDIISDEIKNMIDSISAPVFLCSDEFKIIFCNNALKKCLEYTRCNSLKFIQNYIEGISNEIDKDTDNEFFACISEALGNKTEAKTQTTLIQDNNKMIGMDISARYISNKSEDLICVTLKDITAKKHLQLSEPLFYHDLTNLSAGLSAYLDVMINYNQDNVIEQLPELKAIADQITDLVLLEREMSRAETENLTIEPYEITISEIFADLKDKMNAYNQEINENNFFIVHPKDDPRILTDEKLVLRILCNMILNGVENAPAESMVTVSARHNKEKKTLTFTVHNQGVMSPEIQKNIFMFGFTTKGRGHGRGTYAMKLIGENILQGEVRFESREGFGTAFYLTIPEELEEKEEN